MLTANAAIGSSRGEGGERITYLKEGGMAARRFKRMTRKKNQRPREGNQGISLPALLNSGKGENGRGTYNPPNSGKGETQVVHGLGRAPGIEQGLGHKVI